MAIQTQGWLALFWHPSGSDACACCMLAYTLKSVCYAPACLPGRTRHRDKEQHLPGCPWGCWHCPPTRTAPCSQGMPCSVAPEVKLTVH